MELNNGIVRVIVVPSIGRIMHYGFIDGTNILYEDSTHFGKTLDQGSPLIQDGQPVWAAFGGDRIWPSEEGQFVVINGHKRPPDHWIDGLPWQCTLLENGVEITSPVSQYCGVQVTRRIQLSPVSSRVTIDQSMTKVQQAQRSDLEPIALTIKKAMP